MKGILSIIILGLILFSGYFFFAENESAETVLQESKKEQINIVLVGDIMLDRGVEYAINKEGEEDFRFPFLKIADDLKEADLLFGNLESVISDKGTKVGSIYSFRAKPEAMEGLVYIGFDVLSLANNHAFDYTREALEDTFFRFKNAGIEYTGAGLSESEACSPVIKEINDTKIGFLAYTNLGVESWRVGEEKSGIALISEKDFEKIKSDIKSAKDKTDVLIVSIHSGEEYREEPNQFQKDFSKMAIEAGADIVAGHHPHVVQPTEIYQLAEREGYIAYSLGNFIFDQDFSDETMNGLMIKIVVENKKIKEIIPIKTQLNENFQVEIFNESDEAVLSSENQTTETTELPAVNEEDIAREQIFPKISLSSEKVKQGDTILVKIGEAEISQISGSFNSKELKFFEAEGKIFSLIGIDAKAKEGTYKLIINFPEETIEKNIEVLDANFPVTVLAFTKKLEEEGYNATSVASTISLNDTPKLYATMEISSDTAYFNEPFTEPLVEMVNVGAFGNIRKSGDISLRHLGVDLDAGMNTPVYAINDGLVTGTLDLINYGKTLVIDHGLRIFSLYLHLNSFNVSEGEKIKKDQVIGLSGNTGYSIAPHLHLSVKLNGASVDPLKFIETTKE